MAPKVLSLLWSLAKSDDVTADIMDQALAAHIKILDYSCSQVSSQVAGGEGGWRGGGCQLDDPPTILTHVHTPTSKRHSQHHTFMYSIQEPHFQATPHHTTLLHHTPTTTTPHYTTPPHTHHTTINTPTTPHHATPPQGRDNQKLTWVANFVEELKEERMVIPAIKQIREVCQLFTEVSRHKGGMLY